MQKKGQIFGVGVGPGDPELLTLKALKIIKKCKYIVYHQTKLKKSHALNSVKSWIGEEKKLISLTYPITKEHDPKTKYYKDSLRIFYQKSTKELSKYLDQGNDLCILAEGDPTLYSSFSYLFFSLSLNYKIEIIPGISSFFAASSFLKIPLCLKDQSLTILSANSPIDKLRQKLNNHDGFIIFKFSTNTEKILTLLKELNLTEKSFYAEYVSHSHQKFFSLSEINDRKIPYFSLIVIPPSSKIFL